VGIDRYVERGEWEGGNQKYNFFRKEVLWVKKLFLDLMANLVCHRHDTAL
jgi:hypothetical protein